MAQDPNGIFEDDADGGLTEFGKRLVETTVEAFKDKIAESHDKLTEVFDAYMEQQVLPTMNESAEDAVAEIRGAARHVVGIWRGAISGNMKVSFQAARSIG